VHRWRQFHVLQRIPTQQQALPATLYTNPCTLSNAYNLLERAERHAGKGALIHFLHQRAAREGGMKAPPPSSSPQESQDGGTSLGGPGSSEAAAEHAPRGGARGDTASRACKSPGSTRRRQRTGKNARGPPLSKVLAELGAVRARAAAECAALQERHKVGRLARVGAPFWIDWVP
jgi:hypothetical protein